MYPAWAAMPAMTITPVPHTIRAAARSCRAPPAAKSSRTSLNSSGAIGVRCRPNLTTLAGVRTKGTIRFSQGALDFAAMTAAAKVPALLLNVLVRA
ncbi:hypothetical protein D3C76_1554320 [compost metagenome]